MAEILICKHIGAVELCAALGDITQENGDAIVNAANSHLAHGGGVAGAIAHRGGRQIGDESRKWIAEHGILPVGEVAVTGAGKLNAKYIIHAVGPRWGEGNEDAKLRNAVMNALQKADELGCASISLPAISTGIFGFPLKDGVALIVRTAREFAQNAGTLRHIRFCNIDRATAELFRSELEKQIAT